MAIFAVISQPSQNADQLPLAVDRHFPEDNLQLTETTWRSRPPDPPEQTTPSEYPQVTPSVDLYPTSDIRFVMLEIAKLTASVERLTADVTVQGNKIDALRHQAAFFKGWITAAVLLIGAFIWVASFFLSAKWDAAIQAFKAIAK